MCILLVCIGCIPSLLCFLIHALVVYQKIIKNKKGRRTWADTVNEDMIVLNLLKTYLGFKASLGPCLLLIFFTSTKVGLGCQNVVKAYDVWFEVVWNLSNYFDYTRMVLPWRLCYWKCCPTILDKVNLSAFVPWNGIGVSLLQSYLGAGFRH